MRAYLLKLYLPPFTEASVDERVKVIFVLFDKKQVLLRSGEVAFNQLPTLPEAEINEAVLAASDSTLTQITLPPLSTHKLSSAVFNALDSISLNDSEQLYVAHGERDPSGKLALAFSNRQLVDFFSRKFLAAGIPLNRVVPACMGLAWEARQWTMSLQNGYWVVRTGAQSGFTAIVDPSNQPPQEIHLALDQTPAHLKPEKIVIQGPENFLSSIDLRAWQHQLARTCFISPTVWPSFEAITLNLLPSNQRSDPEQWSRWRLPIIAGMVSLAIWIIGLNIHAWQLYQEQTKLRKTITATIKQAFPELTVILDPIKQARQKIIERQKTLERPKNDDFLSLTAAVSELIPQAGIHIKALEYRGQYLLLSLDTQYFPDSGNLDKKKLQQIIDQANNQGISVVVQQPDNTTLKPKPLTNKQAVSKNSGRIIQLRFSRMANKPQLNIDKTSRE